MLAPTVANNDSFRPTIFNIQYPIFYTPLIFIFILIFILISIHPTRRDVGPYQVWIFER